ncbi:hypothetical protein ES705_33568 [subsurface metagenome]
MAIITLSIFSFSKISYISLILHNTFILSIVFPIFSLSSSAKPTTLPKLGFLAISREIATPASPAPTINIRSSPFLETPSLSQYILQINLLPPIRSRLKNQVRAMTVGRKTIPFIPYKYKTETNIPPVTTSAIRKRSPILKYLQTLLYNFKISANERKEIER